MAEAVPATETLLAGCLSATTVDTARPRAWEPPAPGDLAGVFPQLDVLELIGHGGMGAVYRARQTPLQRTVALKLLPPHLATRAFRERFRREGQILANLKHPHIVAIHDVGETRGWQYLVMEYIDGASLRAVMATGPFTPSAVLRLADEVLAALAYAHGRGIIHRDLKPENILLDQDGRALLADFGLAKQAGDDPADGITRTGEVLGTMRYMAPEQRAGATVDHRADLYAVGVILAELTTGGVPSDPPAPSAPRVVMDARVEAVIARALERTPELRWPSAAAMAAALAPAQPTLRPPTPAWRRPHLWALCGGMILAGIATGQVLAHPQGATPRAAPAPAVSTSPASVAPTLVPPPPPVTAAPAAVAPRPAVPATPGVSAATTVAPAAPAASAPSSGLAAPAPAPAAAVVAGPSPAPAPTIAAAPALDLQALVIDGPGELTLTVDPTLARGTDVRPRLPDGVHPGPAVPRAAAGGSEPITLTVDSAHCTLAVPPGIHWLRYQGSGALRIVGWHGTGVVLEHLGEGSLTLDGLRLRGLDLRVGAAGVTRLEGSIDHLQLAALAPPPGPGGASDEGTPGEVDAADCSVRTIAGRIDGHVRVRLAGHSEQLELSVGDGELLGAELAVDDAVVAITGTGRVLLGEVLRLDAHAPPGQLHARLHRSDP